MRWAFTTTDKRRIIACTAALVVGLLMMSAAIAPYHHVPPQCPLLESPADTGYTCNEPSSLYVVWLLGFPVALMAASALVASTVFALAAQNVQKAKTALVITLAIMGIGLAVCWYIFIGASSVKNAGYQAELQKRQASFVRYAGIPNIASVASRSDALGVTPATGSVSSVSIDLHGCSPGATQVSYAGGSIHFVFSGVKKDESLGGLNASECIFYMGKETAGQKWDGSLPAKCTWHISDTLSGNRLQFPVTSDGVQFGDFLGNCQDLRSGVAPNL